ncbi:MAG: molybdopterin molybdotransferase MoeA [Deltaproteobacteria bacterium]|nr:molybdopterin molybdotransferase MoeA [Deltaproteobacteria bacterium]
MPAKFDIGFEEALSLAVERLFPLQAIDMAVEAACGFVSAEDCYAVVDCPSATSSLKDGFAVVSADVSGASKDHPVRLMIGGMIGAGDDSNLIVQPGLAVKVMTGANIPQGADAVVAQEFIREENNHVIFYRGAVPEKNILTRGSDVAKGRPVAIQGDILAPAMTGLLAAGGLHTVKVHPRPRIGIIATGDEVVAPGRPLKAGQLYASNLVTLISWLQQFRMEAESVVVPDQEKAIRNAMEEMLVKVDALMTSGGAWKSERDLTTRILAEMGGDLIFHRVRLGPGKAVALILVDGKPVFCLPGGPPSNEMAFLQIALPGLLHMTGRPPTPFGTRKAHLSAPVGGDITWTQFFQAKLEKKNDHWLAHPLMMKSRLQSQASAEALIKVPQGVERLNEGDEIEVQILRTCFEGN